ncbi:hypothetical protein B0H67DRAFT_614301 [Lasiosphaeris hirsuta]|uniref:DUF6594 domain-containing protein n=1 Tax=Lasiosphaeris hirsuta TaxID=260670 RepID=A0AA40DIX1_9PEZI|nr:hypothetical protein B0H67DRAFT_614301 [Lasiosphaeris hirsuta]
MQRHNVRLRHRALLLQATPPSYLFGYKALTEQSTFSSAVMTDQAHAYRTTGTPEFKYCLWLPFSSKRNKILLFGERPKKRRRFVDIHSRQLVRKQRVPDDFEAPALAGGSRGSAKARREADLFALRLWFSLLGGLALTVPVLVMVLYKGGENVPLITTSVSTILFAVAMANFSTQPPWNLVATTAAYVAVLVVFVGSSSSPSSA